MNLKKIKKSDLNQKIWFLYFLNHDFFQPWSVGQDIKAVKVALITARENKM